MGMLGAPMDVKRPLLARKSQGSKREAILRMIQVIPAEVESQTMKRSDTLFA
jgi:hypothetical protein